MGSSTQQSRHKLQNKLLIQTVIQQYAKITAIMHKKFSQQTKKCSNKCE
jgi:hypothetical protein